jgi:hypothetical protein
MVVGFNHNIRYKGQVFHVQTEDSGVQNPFITTLLYRDGTIIGSKKTSYADIIKVEMLAKVVEDIMKDQHKEILRRLKAGEFDDRAFPDTPPSVQQQTETETETETETKTETETASSPVPSEQPHQYKQNLDEVILDYLASEGEK